MKRFLICVLTSKAIFFSAQVQDTLVLPLTPLHESYERLQEQNPLQASNLLLGDYTQTTLSYQVRDAGLKRVQTPEQTTAYRFKAKGLYNANENLRLFAHFGYEHLQEKNMGYNLSSRRTDTDLVLKPNYLLVPKAANWETQNYELLGGASFKAGEFLFGAQAHYNAQSSYRKLDPRPAVLTAHYGGTLRAGYQIGEHQVSVNGGVGRITENNDVMAVNEYINAPAYPDTFVRFSNGYGRVINFPSYANFLYETTTHHYGAGYQFTQGSSQLNLNYDYRYALESLYGKDANSQVYIDPELLRMKYRLVEHAMFGSYLTRLGKQNILAEFGANLKTGDNFNKQEDAQNYRMTSDKFYLKLQSTALTKKGLNAGFRFKNEFHFFRAQDLLGVTDKISDSWTLQLSVLREVYQNPKATLSLELGVKQYTVLKNALDFTSASSSSLFYDGVIRPDYLYDGLNKTGGFLEVSFLGKLKKQSNYKIFANFEGLFKNGSATEFPHSFQRPFSSGELGLVIYY